MFKRLGVCRGRIARRQAPNPGVRLAIKRRKLGFLAVCLNHSVNALSLHGRGPAPIWNIGPALS
jgi:hypothetical protein